MYILIVIKTHREMQGVKKIVLMSFQAFKPSQYLCLFFFEDPNGKPVPERLFPIEKKTAGVKN